MKVIENVLKLCVVLALVFLAAGAVQPVDASGEVPPDLLVRKKVVEGSLTQAWTWTIEKTVDQAQVTLPQGQTHTADYLVTVNATESEAAWTVQGTITVLNQGTEAINIGSVQEVLDNGTSTAAKCAFGGQPPAQFPISLPAGWSLTCGFSVSGTGTTPTANHAIVTANGNEFYSDEIAITYVDETVTDGCVTVNDNMVGLLGQVCASDGQQTFSFSYSKDISYDECGEYTVDNTASFVTNDTDAMGEAGAQVQVSVPCDTGNGCTLTYGYWQTHSKHGPAPYDNTWDAKDGGDAEFLGTGVSYYDILQTKPQGGNAFYILAHQYIAAEMNSLNGASMPGEVQSAWDQARVLLEKYEDDLAIPKKSADRDEAIALAETLDAYNNGELGPGHCN